MAPLFKRNDKTTIAELEEYYANQNKKRSAMAWVMALLSILITIAFILALFFGGRWIYRTIFSDDTTTETTSSDGSEVELPNFDSNELGEDRGLSFEDGSSDNPDDLVLGEDDGTPSTSEGTVSDEAASTSIPNDGSSVGGESDDQATTTIPNTGAGETAIAILFATVVLGYLGSRKFFADK